MQGISMEGRIREWGGRGVNWFCRSLFSLLDGLSERWKGASGWVG